MPREIDIERVLDRAEECRVLAGIVADETAASSYMRLAASYEAMAEEERRMIAVRAARAMHDRQSNRRSADVWIKRPHTGPEA